MKRKSLFLLCGFMVLLLVLATFVVAQGYEWHCSDFDPPCTDTSSEGCWCMRNTKCTIFCVGSDPIDCGEIAG